MAFIVMMLTRLGGKALDFSAFGEEVEKQIPNDLPLPFGELLDFDAGTFGWMVSIGFFYLLIIQIICLLLGESSPYEVLYLSNKLTFESIR